MVDEFKRNIAFKIRISDILNSSYTKQGGFDPNFVEFGSMQVSRVNVMGVLVSVSTEEGQVSFQHLILEDGSGRISLRVFDSPFKVSVGDIVQVIGKIREFNNEKYIIPEIVRHTDPAWIQFRNKELDVLYKDFYDISQPSTPPGSGPVSDKNIVSDSSESIVEHTENVGSLTVKSQDQSPADLIISIIRELDSGRGASFEDVSAKVSFDNTDQIIRNLLLQGEIFELTPGKYKVLE